MKNLHLLPTEKPSRLCYVICTEKATLTLFEDAMDKASRFFPQNIYIPSDGKIKEGDWYLFPLFKGGYEIKQYNSKKHFAQEPCISLANLKAKKIILTTDQDLIKDGVQAIGDEFLELFVKNPSYDSVEVETVKFCLEKASISLYQIITPKQIGFKVENGKRTETFYREPKQETLEEVAEKFAKKFGSEIDSTRYYAFINGAKWQQEQDKNKFSEAIDIFEYILEYDDGVGIALGYNSRVMIERFIKQFKNK
jgi:hypothetical protein